ncbi:MAG: TlpA disulfide reductase family protein [Kofleriaceae bacterium]
MPRIAPLLLMFGLVTAAACKPQTPVPAGDIAARLTVATAAGAPFDPATLRGQPALVVFWRPGCPHCLAEIPDAVRLAKDTGATIVAVQVAGRPEVGAAVLAKANWTGPHLIDDGSLREGLKIKGVPYTLALRANGSAARAMIGRRSYDELKSALSAAR